MNQQTKEMLSKNKLHENPQYTTEDLKSIAEVLNYVKVQQGSETDDEKGWNIIKQLQAFDYDPILFESWLTQYEISDDYDYRAIFFDASVDRLPLLLGEGLDSIEDVILRWRLEHNK